MKELIHIDWRPSKKTINTLKVGGWSDEQRKRILIGFINDKRYQNKEIEGASSIYNTWVRFETPRKAKEKETGEALKEILKQKSHGSKDGIKKAQQAKNPPTDIMSQTEVEAFYNKRNN